MGIERGQECYTSVDHSTWKWSDGLWSVDYVPSVIIELSDEEPKCHQLKSETRKHSLYLQRSQFYNTEPQN